ncbi:MAG: hypothetical protein RIF41_31585 [Polyangiaceae bacterium]
MDPFDNLDDHRPDEAAFEILGEVLDGKRRVEPDAKMLWIVLGDQREAAITRGEFVVHFGAMKRRRPMSYYRRYAPGILSYLLASSDAGEVRDGAVIGLPMATPPHLGKDRFLRTRGSLTVWIVRATETVRVVVRKAAEAWQEPHHQPIPEQGPLTLPDPPVEWRPADKVWIDFKEPLPCERCGVASVRYRRLPDALICPSCGCSFKHPT